MNMNECKKNLHKCTMISQAEENQHFIENINDALDGNYYTLANYNEWVNGFNRLPIITKKKIGYYNIPCSFDIETTSFYNEDGQKTAIMYIWMFSIYGRVIIGRKWEEFTELVNKLRDDLHLDAEKRIIVCYIQNLSFEFGFISNRFKWKDTFSNDVRKPIMALSEDGIQFKCSQYLSGTSLAQIGKELTMFPIPKLVGDLDYNLIRNYKTILSPKEMQYCINDVLVLQSFIMEKIIVDGDITKIPLTKTGYVRHLLRDNCLYDKHSHKSKESGNKYLKYREFMSKCTMTPQEYKQSKRTYQGGFTHGNAFNTGKIINEPVQSMDFTSSYPAVLIMEKYPCGQPEEIEIHDIDELLMNCRKYWCMFDIEFTDLVATFPYEHYISRSKCWLLENEMVDNGRVSQAARLCTSVTGEDFNIIYKTYSWSKCTIYNFKRYHKYYLPTDFVKTVVELYKKKTTMKGVSGMEIEYMMSKANLNSLYGNCVCDIVRNTITYKNGWCTESANLDESIEHYNKSKTRVNSYLWGIACTSFSRFNLWTGILECSSDYLYSDTDSIKYKNPEKHQSYFDNYNLMVEHKLKIACNYHNIPFDDVAPHTMKGEVKMIGVWDFDGKYKAFKYLGAKRYMCVDENDELHITIAGVSKKNGLRYLKAKYKTNDAILNAFTDDLLFPEEYTDKDGEFCASGKMIHTYIDDERTGTLTDHQGHTAEYHEFTGVHLESTEYNLSLSSEYINYLLRIGTIITC